MTPSRDPLADLRRLSPAELAKVGDDHLREHLLAQAAVARHKHGPLHPDHLGALLEDPECVRYPTRLVFEFGEMALHQFAQPEIDWRDPSGGRRVLYVHPSLRERAELLPLAVAYMIPVINYGNVVTDEHCLLYGATLLGLSPDEFYRQICALADGLGAEPRYADSPDGADRC